MNCRDLRLRSPTPGPVAARQEPGLDQDHGLLLRRRRLKPQLRFDLLGSIPFLLSFPSPNLPSLPFPAYISPAPPQASAATVDLYTQPKTLVLYSNRAATPRLVSSRSIPLFSPPLSSPAPCEIDRWRASRSPTRPSTWPSRAGASTT